VPDDKDNKTPTGRITDPRAAFALPYGKSLNGIGKVYVNADFSAIEERIAEGLMGAAAGSNLLDPYKIIAAVTHIVMYSEVTKEQRQWAKSYFYLNLYSTEGFSLPPRVQLFAIYTTEEIVQIQIDTKWPGTLDLYDHIANFYKPKV